MTVFSANVRGDDGKLVIETSFPTTEVGLPLEKYDDDKDTFPFVMKFVGKVNTI